MSAPSVFCDSEVAEYFTEMRTLCRNVCLAENHNFLQNLCRMLHLPAAELIQYTAEF